MPFPLHPKVRQESIVYTSTDAILLLHAAKRKKMADEEASKLRVVIDLSYGDLMSEKVGELIFR